MPKKDTKSFKVPRIKRVESKDNLRQVDITSRDCLEIVNTVKRSYLASDYESSWKLKTAALVENRELDAVYRAKKADLKEEGRHARDLTDHFAFVVQRDNTIVPHVVKDGLKCKSVHQYSLGDSKLGLYVCRNADVQLRYAEGWKVPTCTLMVYKIVLGKCKPLVQQGNEEKIEPTPNYDCHIPQVQARPSDNFMVQLARSQVYLYEYTDDCEPSIRPRQILPYAVLTYEKADNVPSSSLSSKVDSYSKRPTYTPRSSDVDTAKPTAQVIMNRRDPRLSQAKVKPGESDGGLCVPRLTPGPPPKEPPTSTASDLDDPRSQLSFLTSSNKPAFDDYLYQPSFGPGSEEQEIPSKDEEVQDPKEPLTSLPPLNLPRMPSPNSQLDTRYTDPRFGYVDSNTNVPPSDPGYVPVDPRLRTNAPSFPPNEPRFRPNDPRVQSLPSDPRLRQMPLDPRRQQRPMDPRIQQRQTDPRMNTIDNRLQKTYNINTQQLNREDTTKTRKKLSLSDYKKKVNISKPVITKELSESTNEIEPVKDNSDSSSGKNTQSITQTSYSDSVLDTETDPELEDQDFRIRPNTGSSSTSTAYESNCRLPDETFVEKPDDMAKTLNELSDPDDVSQSPKQCDENNDNDNETVVKPPTVDDPMLSDAMKKLVEHSGNVTLFTEALRLLQESAEQFGDQLTDPEFLVKKIAEKIDELSNNEVQKVKDEKNEEQNTSNIVEDVKEIYSPEMIKSPDSPEMIKSPDSPEMIKSPDSPEMIKSPDSPEMIKSPDSPEMIKSPDISNEFKTDEVSPVKHIPLENVDNDPSKTLECVDMEISDQESEEESGSQLDLAMQKTLEELAKVEQSQLIRTNLQSNNQFSNTDKPKTVKRESAPPLNLLDIPIPKGPPVQLKQNVSKTMQQTKPASVPKTKIGSDDDEMKVSQILPSLQDKKKATISINLKMNQKPKVKPVVPDIFKDDIDLRVKEKKHIDLDYDHIDKDYRIFPGHQKQSNKATKDKVEKSDTGKKRKDAFDSSKLDIDHRKNAKPEKKFIDTERSDKNNSDMQLQDPFGLGTEDIDHRKVSEPDILQKKEVNDFGDVDWRSASDVADVDMRSANTSTENSQSSTVEDFDLRHSRSVSRSVSPPPSRIVTSDEEKAKFKKAPVRKFVDPFGLDEDIDERVISRSNSPLVSEKGKPLRIKEIAAESTHDSNSGSSALFDAYSLGKSKSEVSNEFGDIDWRQAAAAEMGDVDMRSVPGEQSKQTNKSDQSMVTSSSAPVIIPPHSAHFDDPFQQMNKNLQSMFNINQNIPAYQTSPYDSYSTSVSNISQSYGQYTTSKNEVLQEYTTSKVNSEYLPSYTTSALPSYSTSSGSQQKTTKPDGIHNIIQNLDFSNLKNILATVKPPGSSSDTAESPAKDKEEDDKPAFVTGLSSMNSKPSFTRKYGSATKQMSSPVKRLNVEKTVENKSEHEPNATRIPGFDVSPEKEETEGSKTTPTKEKPDNKSIEKSKLKINSSPTKSKENEDSLPSTPKKQTKPSESDDNMTPLPNISYQTAILESMEQSALKIRNDDSFTSEMEDSPMRLSKRQRRKHHAKNSKEDSDSAKKRRKVSDVDIFGKDVKQKWETKVVNDDDDDDDEESGLVIDLDMMSPIVKHSSEKDTVAGKDGKKVYKEDLTEMNEPVLDLTEDDEPILVIADDDDGDENQQEKSSDDLQAEDTLQAKTKDEMTSMIETSRKNMVIKLKGQTKLVNPKTGKAYNECPKGSAIEVVGNASSSRDSTVQIHPIHGIVPKNQDNTSTTISDKTNFVKGQPIYAIGKPNITTASEVGTVTGTRVYGQVPQRNQDESPIPGSSSSSKFRDQAPISNIIGTNVPTINQVHGNPLDYIHPITGQKVVYGRLPQSGITPTMPQPVISPLPEPPLAGQSLVPRQVLVLPGQGPPGSAGIAGLPYPPTNFNQQRPGLNIPTIRPGNTVGQQTKSSPIEAKTSTDVFDCFRDKYEKRSVKNETVTSQSYAPGTASETKMAYSVKMFLEDIENKAKKELNVQANARTITTIIKGEPVVKNTFDDSTKSENNPALAKAIDTIVKGEPVVKKTSDNSPKIENTDINSKKRPGDGDGNTVPVKKTKSEFDAKSKSQNDFGSKILESLTEVKNKLRSPEKMPKTPEKPKTIPEIELKPEVKVPKDEVKKDSTESGASSELEDGEISEDSPSETEEPQVNDTPVGSSIPVLGSRPGQFNRIPTVGSWQQGPINTGMTFGNNTPPRQITTIGSGRPNPSAFNVGADWADIIQNPETRTIERVKATKIESPSLHSIIDEGKNDTASLVSKSAASISRSRQKNKAQSQVKTLGEWLKLELEIDNIEPLQNIIPYDLDTDLTKIPKQRKRRIRMKVKNAIEQEGTKASSHERQETVTVEVLLHDQQSPSAGVSYSPEVSNEQTERELKMVCATLNTLRDKVTQQTAMSGLGNPFQPGVSGQFLPRSVAGSLEDKKLIIAMTLVQTEMKTHLGRTCFYGYPHRRVPDELLLSNEKSGFKSEAEEVFLILMMPLSTKPYNKLLQLKNKLCDLYERRKSIGNPTEATKIDEEIRQSHNQRQALLRGFTGYLNKKRIQKLQETVDKYTMVYDFFRSKTPSTPDSMLRFIRTTQIDLRQHLILAKQYLALEAQKMQ